MDDDLGRFKGEVSRTATSVINSDCISAPHVRWPARPYSQGKITTNYGEKPGGEMILTSDGHVMSMSIRTDLPKFASAERASGTSEENRAVVQGSLAYYGTYSVGGGHDCLPYRKMHVSALGRAGAAKALHIEWGQSGVHSSRVGRSWDEPGRVGARLPLRGRSLRSAQPGLGRRSQNDRVTHPKTSTADAAKVEALHRLREVAANAFKESEPIEIFDAGGRVLHVAQLSDALSGGGQVPIGE